MEPQGTLTSSLDYQYYQTNHLWNKQGNKIPLHNHFQQDQGRAYLDYQLTSQDALAFTVDYKQIKESMNGNSRGLGDIELSWKRNIYQYDSHHFATRLALYVPGGKSKYNLRYGRFAGELDLLYSANFKLASHCFYYDCSLGYRVYEGFPSDQFRAGFRAGYHLNSWLQILTIFHLNYGVFNGRHQIHPTLVLLNPNYRLLTGQIQAVIHFPYDLYGILGYQQHLWGENVGTSGGYFGGLCFQY